MKISISHRILTDKRKSLYLDYYQNGARVREFLKLYLLPGKTSDISAKNSEVMKIAKHIAHNRGIELVSNDYSNYGITPKFKKSVDFVTYFEKFLADYTNKDIRLVRCSLEKFKAFISLKGFKKISGNQLTENLCKEFKQYLEANLYGETPYNYFTKFKKVLRQAVKDKILSANPADEIRNTKTVGLKKQILDTDEINQLAKTPHSNNQIKRAFLFCLNTGLRYCDVKELRWKNIDIKSKKLIFIQTKTKHSSKIPQVTIDLNHNSINLIGEVCQPDELVFQLPSINGCNKGLKVWCKNAGIAKKITWHCARHSIAVNLLRSDVGNADVKTVASILGHSSIIQTEKYLHHIDKLKSQAVNKLPEFEVFNEI